MTDTPSLLSLRDLTVRYSGITAVDHVTFDLAEGTVVGLIGPNGAGKTSLVDAVTGFADSTGEAILEGRSLSGVRAHRRARRGLVRTFQGAELFEGLTVEQNMLISTFGGSIRGIFEELRRLGGPRVPPVVDELVAELGLEDVRHTIATDLPLGVQKLVTVGRAMAARPKVLLLDEPAAGLDSQESREFGAMLRRMSRHASTVLLIEHDIDLVLRICDRVHVLEFGKLIASGTPDEIRTNPEVIKAYLGVAH